jgi:hypothetical protein
MEMLKIEFYNLKIYTSHYITPMNGLTAEEIRAEQLSLLNTWKQHHTNNLTFLLNFRKQLGFSHQGPSPLDAYINYECQFTGYLTGLISSDNYMTETYLYKYFEYFQAQAQTDVKSDADTLEVDCDSNEIIETAVKNSALELVKPELVKPEPVKSEPVKPAQPKKEKFDWSTCKDDQPDEKKKDDGHNDGSGRGGNRDRKYERKPDRSSRMSRKTTPSEPRRTSTKRSGGTTEQLTNVVLDALVQANPQLQPTVDLKSFSDFKSVASKKTKKIAKRVEPWTIAIKPTMYASKYRYDDGTETDIELYFEGTTNELYYTGKNMYYIGKDTLLYKFDKADKLTPVLDRNGKAFWWQSKHASK